jgi:uncharacterized protein (DUF1015 family)
MQIYIIQNVLRKTEPTKLIRLHTIEPLSQPIRPHMLQLEKPNKLNHIHIDKSQIKIKNSQLATSQTKINQKATSNHMKQTASRWVIYTKKVQ